MKTTTIEIMNERTDIHQRTKKVQKLEERITKDENITRKNRELLLSYDKELEKQFLKGNLSNSGWQKSLEEAYAFTKKIDKDIHTLSKADIQKWFNDKEKKFMNRELSAWTLIKYYNQIRKYLKFALQLNDERIAWFDWVKKELPPKPKNNLMAKDLPSQEQVKKLIVALRNQGNKNAIRNAAIIALANDTGARISEVLSMKNDCVMQEKNYLVITLPESKTNPRSVIAFISKQYITEWESINPNRSKGKDALFFCDRKGEAVKYHILRKQLSLAAKTIGFSFPKNKAMHLFRKIFASRSYNWPEIPRNYWLGWSSGISDVYTSIDHRACAEHYFKMLEQEKNPMYGEKPLWRTEGMNPEEREQHKKMILEIIRGEFGTLNELMEERLEKSSSNSEQAYAKASLKN